MCIEATVFVHTIVNLSCFLASEEMTMVYITQHNKDCTLQSSAITENYYNLAS